MLPRSKQKQRLLCILALIPCCSVSEGLQQEELEDLRRLNREKPGDFHVLTQLASSLHQLDHSHPDGGSRVLEAEQAYRGAIKAAPNDFARCVLLGNLGALFLSAGKLNEALATLHHSIEMGIQIGSIAKSNTAGSLFNRGKAFAALGNEKEAQHSYRLALAAAEGVAPGSWTKCCAAMKQHTAAELLIMEEAATALSLFRGSISSARMREKESAITAKWQWIKDASAQDQCWLYFGLYAAYEAKGSYSKAWDALVMGNQLQKDSLGAYGTAQDRQLLSALKAVFPLATERLQHSSEMDVYDAFLSGQGGSMDETPIFIVGMPRSGSTLVEQILASHPQVVGAGEDTELAPLIPRLLGILEGGSQRHVHFNDVKAVGETYVAAMRRRFSKGRKPARIVDKMLRNAWNLGYIALMLPKAKIIWTTRHPLDVALSCFAQPFEGRGTPWAWSLDDIASQIELTHEIMSHWERLLPGKILRVSLEELIAQQEATSRRLLSFCGLKWDAAVVNFHKTKRDVRTASQSQVRHGLDVSATGKHRRYSRQLADLRQRLQPLIGDFEAYHKLGYIRDEL